MLAPMTDKSAEQAAREAVAAATAVILQHDIAWETFDGITPDFEPADWPPPIRDLRDVIAAALTSYADARVREEREACAVHVETMPQRPDPFDGGRHDDEQVAREIAVAMCGDDHLACTYPDCGCKKIPARMPAVMALVTSYADARGREGAEAEGWAVVENGEINVKTVSPTRRAAIVNWLVVDHDVMITRHTADRTIEAEWLARHPEETDAVPVTIRARPVTP